MPEFPNVGELFTAKAITDDQVNAAHEKPRRIKASTITGTISALSTHGGASASR